MSHPNKRRGTEFENTIVRKLAEKGIPAERVPLSGSIGGKYSDDIDLFPETEHKYKAECKKRKNGEGFKVIENWIGDLTTLFIGRNRKPPMVVLTWAHYVELLEAWAYDRGLLTENQEGDGEGRDSGPEAGVGGETTECASDGRDDVQAPSFKDLEDPNDFPDTTEEKADG
jgi:Holliday junction resolvase